VAAAVAVAVAVSAEDLLWRSPPQGMDVGEVRQFVEAKHSVGKAHGEDAAWLVQDGAHDLPRGGWLMVSMRKSRVRGASGERAMRGRVEKW